MRNILLVIFLFCSIVLNASTNIISWNPPAGGLKKTYSESYSFNANSGDILTCRCNGTISSGSQVDIYLTVNGERKTIYTHTNPNFSFDDVVTYQFQDDGVFTLSYNYTHNGGGTAYKISINATLNDFVKCTSVQLDATSLLLDVGDTYTLVPIITPEYASNKTVDWVSSDESVATISSEGVITALKAGATTITASSADGTRYSTSCNVAVRNLSEHHEYIDLGLPSGTLWATSNIGAHAPEEQGDNYAWGELHPSENFWTSDSKKYTVTKYNSNDNLTELEPDDDVATVMWGSNWEIPSKEDFQELIDNCKLSFYHTSAATSPNGYVIVKLTAKNGNYILLPQSDILASKEGIDIYYWTSSVNPQSSLVLGAYQSAYSYYAQTSTNHNTLWTYERWRSMPIRPISKFIKIKELSILPTLDLNVGENCQLEANIIPDNATNPSIVWSSNNESVAIVGQDGKITAIKTGIAEIKAMTTDGSDLSAICRVSVHNPVTSVNLDKKSLTMHVTESLILKAICTPVDADNTSISWSSSNNSIVTVDDGTITAIGVGSAIVTASSVNGLSAICNVTVETTYANSLTINKTSLSLISGEQESLTATILPSYTTNNEITWKSSAKNIVTVSNSGLVKAVATGTAIITATTTDGTNLSATCVVDVTNPVKSVTLSKDLVELEVEESETIIANCTPSNADDISISWHSKDINIATVINGKIEAISVGETEIVAKSVNGVEAICIVRVVPTLVTSISIPETSINIYDGDVFQLKANITPSNATNKYVTWSSSNTGIATVDNNGVVTAVKVGTATITATTTDGTNLSATCKVTVDPVLATSISLSRTSASIKSGATLQLTCTLKPDNVTSKAVKWSSSNTGIATVDNNGVVTAVKVGTATITASTTDGTNLNATCKVTVDPVLATSISLSRTSASVKTGETLKLTYTLKPDNVTSKDVKWSSSDAKIATVDSNGMVTAIKVGTATITATTTDGSNLSATCKVTVDPVLATSISLSRTSASVKSGATLQLTYTLKPDNVTSTAVKWSSSDTKIATVDSNGMVTAIKVGTATITATTTDGTNLSATCKVTVDPILATSISISSTSLDLEVGHLATLSATILPENTTNKNKEWSSSNQNIATVSEGIVTAVSPGTCVIKVKTVDGSNLTSTCTVVVADIPVSTLSIDKTSIDLLVEEETLITASVYPADATNKALVWSSSNGSVASVSNGKVKALNAGSAIISVRTTDGSDKMETCNVTVKKHSQTIEWNQDLSYITYGGELIGLKATASSGLPVVFSSSNDNVASIIDMGSIVYLNPGNPGSSKITATQGGNYYYESVSVVKDANVIDPSGVENVTDSSEKYTIYDIAGLRIGTYTQQEYDELISNKLIPAGIYIVNGLKKFIGK